MEDVKLTNIMFDEVDWDGILIPENVPEEEKEKHVQILSEYFSKRSFDSEVNLSDFEHTIEIKIDNSFIDKVETDFERITNEELFQYLQSENIEVSPDYLFPKTNDIGQLFWFLHNLSRKGTSDSKIKIMNLEDLSIHFYQILENALFFGYFNRVQNEKNIYLLPTNQFIEFATLDIEHQYQNFLSSLGRNETISEALRLQLNDPIFDSISRQMLYNALVKDPNIQAESLSSKEVQKIVNNLRYWYLAIKNKILENS